MKRVLILYMFLIIGEISANAATNFFPPLQAVDGSNSFQNYSSNGANYAAPFAKPSETNRYSDIDKIEQTLFGKNYSNQNISDRLSRIEKNIFSTTYPSATNAQRIDNIILNFNQINKYPNISKSGLSRIESQVFGQSFPQYSAERRIEKLEQQLLGATQSGDLSARFETLKIAVKASKRSVQPDFSQYNNFSQYNDFEQYSSNPLLTTNSGVGRRRTNWGSIVGGGTMTGFTPPITPFYGTNYNSFCTPSQMNRYGMSSGYGVNRSPYGYRVYDGTTSTGSGIGVTILD